MSTSGIAVACAVVVLAVGPTVYASIVSTLAMRLDLSAVRRRIYRTSPWAYILVSLCALPLLHLFLIKGVDTTDYVTGGLILLAAVVLLVFQAQTLVKFDTEEVTVKEGPKSKAIKNSHVIRGEVGFVGISVVHSEGKTLIQWGISRPWEILAALNFNGRENSDSGEQAD